jgi:hypothetical protein
MRVVSAGEIPVDDRVQVATSRRLVPALRVLALSVVLLHLAAPLMAEGWAWGVWPATYLPPVWRWVLATVAILLILAGDRVAARIAAFWRSLTWAALTGAGWPRTRLAVALLTLIPFYLLHIVHTRWGDAYILVNAIPHPQVHLTYSWQAPLDVWLHAQTWAAGNRLFGWRNATPAYTIWSPIAGAIFVWLLLGLARWLGRNRAERWLIFGLIATLGTMQLFFGYIENYVLMTVGLLAYAWLALRALRGETPIFWAAAVLAATHAFNPSTVFIAPSILYVIWNAPVAWPGDAPRQGSVRTRWRAVTAVAAPYLVMWLGVLAFMTAGGHGLHSLLTDQAPGGADRNWFVPLSATITRWEHYTMFSAGHLLDIVNEQFLAAPVIWPALLLAALCAWPLLPLREREFRFLLLYAGLYLLFTMTWNADFGGQRDWDLFSVAALPAALLLGYTLPRVLPERQALTQAGWALVAAQAYHTLAWIYQNTRPWEWPKS